MSARELSVFALDFVRSEFVPTLWALAAAALREPIAWAAIGAGALLWRRVGSSARARRP